MKRVYVTAGEREMNTQLRTSIEPGLQTIRTLWKPFVAIQLLGLAIVLSYFYWSPVTTLFDRIADLKVRVGIAFAAISMPIACGLLPELFKTITGVAHGWPRSRLTFMLHNALLFVVLGVIVEYFYTCMNGWLGTSKSAGTVLTKVCIDQFFYSTLFAVPAITLSFNWRNRGYRIVPALRDLNGGWFMREVVPVLLVNWAYWFPMGTLMYTLPTKLTFIYGVIGNAASATLLTAIAGRKRPVALEAIREREVPTVIETKPLVVQAAREDREQVGASA
jgi:hypothetical protein